MDLIAIRTCINGARLGTYLLEDGTQIYSWVSKNDLDAIEDALGYRPGSTIKINYIKPTGEQTKRTVTILGFRSSKEGNLSWTTYCHEKDDYRSFRDDRMSKVG